MYRVTNTGARLPGPDLDTLAVPAAVAACEPFAGVCGTSSHFVLLISFHHARRDVFNKLSRLLRAESHARELLHDQRISVDFDLADRKSTRLNSSHVSISYAVFCLKKKKAYSHV